ncbi:MAG: hypothetical protein WCV59_04730 [Parcubacteria group bacterium]
MDSLRRVDIGRNKPTGNVVDLGRAKNKLPQEQIIPRRENLPEYSHPAFSKDEPVYYSEVKNDEKIKEKSTKKIRSVFSIALFIMIVVFVAVIGWYEFKNNDNGLEKLLSKNATPADKSAGTTAANTAAQAKAAATAQTQSSAAAQQNQTLPTDSENLNTSATSSDTTSDNANGEKKTYKSDTEGISFDYPAEYKIEENNGQIVATKTDAMWRMKIYDNKDKQEIKEWVDSYFSGKDVSDCNESDSTTLKIGALATKIMKDGEASGKCEGAGYYALNSDKSKIARVRLDKADETEANKILSTFKFTK